MGILRWYKHDPRAFLVATDDMPLELRGAYIVILNLLYVHDGKFPDDACGMCRWLGVDRQVWMRIRRQLLRRNKIYTIDGNIRNERTDREIRNALRSHHRFKKRCS
jgi:uncharacterized protein YdaU (DUF1376 family)